MKILLDTHVIIWALTDDPRLSKAARIAITDPANTIYYSLASIWVSIPAPVEPSVRSLRATIPVNESH